MSENTIPRETLLSISGLEAMQRIVDGTLPSPAMASTMNYRFVAAEPGKVIVEATPGKHHVNPMGTTHGGWFGTILDTCMSCAVMTCVPKGSVYTTLEYKVNLTRGIPPGTPVQAIGTVDHAGRSTAVAKGEIRGMADGKLYGTASTTCLIMQITD